MRYFETRVVENRSLGGGYFQLGLSGCQALAASQPGQFVMLRGDWQRDPLLPRAFSLLSVGPGDRADILAKTVGRGTALLEASVPGTPVFLLGPLGHPFPAPAPGFIDLLVAGGVGLPPLVMQAEHAARAGVASANELLYGGRGAADIILVDTIASLGVALHASTEDGTVGERGLITAVLEKRIAHHLEAGVSPARMRIMACGPNGMLWAVKRVAARRDLACFVSLEEVMACGIGVCLGCAIPAHSRPFRYVCKDGPVFEARDMVSPEELAAKSAVAGKS